MQAGMPRQWERFSYYLLKSPSKLSSLARLTYRTKLASAHALRRDGYASAMPPLMTLQVNKTCNLRCVQCWEWGREGAYKSAEPGTLRDEMPTEAWLRMIDEVSAWRPYLYFFGGEPLIRKDMVQLIEAASRRSLLTAINSNTTLVTPELAERIVASGLDYYIASLDGPEEVNNRIRRGQDVFRKVVNGIRALTEAKRKLGSVFPLIEVCATVTAENHDHLYETAEVVEGLGVDYFRIQFGMFTSPELLARTRERFSREFGVEPKLFSGFVRDTSDIDPARVEAEERRIRERKWSFEYKRYPKDGVGEFDYRDYFHRPETSFGERTCHIPWKRAVVMPNGDVVGCAWFPEAVMGNVKDRSFREIWNGQAMRGFRKSLTENGLFASCTRCCDLYELDESKAWDGIKN